MNGGEAMKFKRFVRMLLGNDAAYQMFQKGFMLWYAPDVIFAITVQGGNVVWWGKYTERWAQSGKPRYLESAPAGCTIPQRGIGYVWHARNLQQRLGFAIGGEEGFAGKYEAFDDGWLVHYYDGGKWDGGMVELHPGVQPVPELTITTGNWVWLAELGMPVNLDHVVWVGSDRLRVGPHDIVLSLPEKTAIALKAYLKTQCVEIA